MFAAAAEAIAAPRARPVSVSCTICSTGRANACGRSRTGHVGPPGAGILVLGHTGEPGMHLVHVRCIAYANAKAWQVGIGQLAN